MSCIHVTSHVPMSHVVYQCRGQRDINIDLDDIGHYRYRHRYWVTVDIDIDIFSDTIFSFFVLKTMFSLFVVTQNASLQQELAFFPK